MWELLGKFKSNKSLILIFRKNGDNIPPCGQDFSMFKENSLLYDTTLSDRYLYNNLTIQIWHPKSFNLFTMSGCPSIVKYTSSIKKQAQRGKFMLLVFFLFFFFNICSNHATLINLAIIINCWSEVIFHSVLGLLLKDVSELPDIKEVNSNRF